jgi:hypothetical protein
MAFIQALFVPIVIQANSETNQGFQLPQSIEYQTPQNPDFYELIQNIVNNYNLKEAGLTNSVRDYVSRNLSKLSKYDPDYNRKVSAIFKRVANSINFDTANQTFTFGGNEGHGGVYSDIKHEFSFRPTSNQAMANKKQIKTNELFYSDNQGNSIQDIKNESKIYFRLD